MAQRDIHRLRWDLAVSVILFASRYRVSLPILLDRDAHKSYCKLFKKNREKIGMSRKARRRRKLGSEVLVDIERATDQGGSNTHV